MFASYVSTNSSSRRGSAVRAAVLLTAAAALAITAAPAGAQVVQSQQHDFTIEIVADGFENPWSIAFLPDGDILVTERPGRLRIIRDGELLPDSVGPMPAVRHEGQGGLQEVAVHPDFESNRLIYLSYAKGNEDNSQSTTALLRARFENDTLTDVEEIFEANAWGERAGHYGAKIAFDADGYLFLSVGDRQFIPQGDLENLAAHPAQNPMTHHGTILRLHDDGSVPDDNPFVGRSDGLPEIWSYGHRNPQGLAINPETGDVWTTEHGPQGGDELNVSRPGLNYGWPVIGYGVNYRTGLAIHATPYREGMEQPEVYWVPSIGASGLAFYTGDAFPMWQGNLFAGGLSAEHQRLSRIWLNEQGGVAHREPLLAGDLRIRDVREGPDGYIYLAVDNRVGLPTPLVRLVPAD